MDLDIREMTFQNVLDTVLKPAGVKVGGFPPEMFKDLGDSEAEEWKCNICFLMVNDARQCDNKHLFCHTCVFAWTMTYGENSQKCPMCRCDQRQYAQNKDVDRLLQDKRVHCMEDGCSFKSPLKIFLMHSHGKLKFSNAHVELESLRPRRPQGAHLLLLPSLGLAAPGANGPQRGTLIRHQLQQGRVMIHQMMMLLNLEMQLRQQSLVSFQQAAEPTVRVQRLDEVLALNEQLNEVGTILSGLLQSPLAGPSAQLLRDEPQAEASGGASASFRVTRRQESTPLSRVSSLMRQLDEEDDDEDDSDSDSDTSSDESLNEPLSLTNNRTIGASQNSNSVLDRSPVSSLEQTLNEGQAALERARERREISRQILSQSQITDNSDGNRGDPILMGRQPGMIPRVGQINRPQERNVISTENTSPATSSNENRPSTTTPTPNSVRRGISSSGTSNGSRITVNNPTPNSISISVTTRLGNTSNSASAAESAALPQLPALSTAGHTMHSTSDALRSLPADRDQSPQEPSTPSPVPSEPPAGPIPQGSLALRQAMNSLSRPTTPGTGRRLSIDDNPVAGGQTSRAGESGVSRASQATSSRGRTPTSTSGLLSSTTTSQALQLSRGSAAASPSTAQQPSTVTQSGARRRSQSQDTTLHNRQRSQASPGQNASSSSGRDLVDQNSRTSTTHHVAETASRGSDTPGANRSGSILPASLYRRRDRPGSSTHVPGTSTDTNNNTPAAHTPTIRAPTQSTNTHTTPSTHTSTRNPREPRSVSIGARQRTTLNTDQQNRKQVSPNRRTSLTRRNALPNRPVINRQISTQSQQSDSGISSISSDTSSTRTGILGTSRSRPTAAHNSRSGGASDASSNLPKLPDGTTRPRRRSEIHQNLILKK